VTAFTFQIQDSAYVSVTGADQYCGQPVNVQRLLENQMNRYPTTQLMTIEEAQQLSDLDTSHEANKERRRMWAWQSVDAVMSQTVDEETLDKMESLRLRK
jgi:hypothetical protein